jgi:hypothetical protein
MPKRSKVRTANETPVHQLPYSTLPFPRPLLRCLRHRGKAKFHFHATARFYAKKARFLAPAEAAIELFVAAAEDFARSGIQNSVWNTSLDFLKAAATHEGDSFMNPG